MARDTLNQQCKPPSYLAEYKSFDCLKKISAKIQSANLCSLESSYTTNQKVYKSSVTSLIRMIKGMDYQKFIDKRDMGPQNTLEIRV